mgnify:CR=1 FL=1
MGGLRDGMGGGTGDPNIKEEIFDGVRLVGDAKLYFRDTEIFIHSDADGSLTIESDGQVTPVNINLKSTGGSAGFVVRDNDGFIVSKLDSAGNVQAKGTLRRTETD